MNPGGGGGHMSYPGASGGYPGGGSGYGYASPYLSPVAGYHHHTSVPPSQISPYSGGQGSLGVMGTEPQPQSSPYGADHYSSKTPPFQQSFQRPYSPNAGFPYGVGATLRHQQSLHMGGQDPGAVDLKINAPIYPNQNYSSAHQNSTPYVGYNGFGHSPHHHTTFNSPDPNKNVENYPDNLSRRPFDYYEKSSGDLSPNPVDNKPSKGDMLIHDEDKSVADDLTLPRVDDNPKARNSNSNGNPHDEEEDRKDFVLKSESESLLNNLDSIPLIPEIPDIKTDNHEDEILRQTNSDPSSPMRSRGLKRSLSPSADTQDSESQDSYAGGGSHPPGMMPSQPENEFMQGMNEGGMQHQFQSHMGYGGQPQMWNYYNNPYSLQQQQQQHPIEPGFQPGMGMGMENPAMCHNSNEWWMGTEQARAGAGSSGEYPPGFRMPFNMQAPGPWALRGPRPRGERRGPGRPRLNATSTKSGPMMDRSLSAGSLGGGRSRMMSPGLSPFSSGLGSGPGSIPSPDMEGLPPSPGFVGSPDDELVRKRQHPPSNVDLMSTSPGGMVGVMPEGKVGKSNSGNKKRFTCEICQKRFSTAWYVRVHRKSHNGERPYTCDTCGKGFMLPNVLLTHKKKCERQNPGGASGLIPSAPTSSSSAPTLPSNIDPSSTPPIGMDPEMHHRTSPLPHHQGHFGINDPFEREELGQMMGGMGRGMFPNSGVGVQSSQQNTAQYNQRFSGPGESGMAYHMGDQMYSNREYLSGNGAQGYGAPQQPLSPQYSYSPTSGGMRPPLGSDNSTSSGSSSLPPPVGSMVPNNLQAHFLGNDRPSDKGGGHGGRLVGGELPPVNKLPLNDNTYCSPCELDYRDDKLEDHPKTTTQRPYSCEICEKRFSQKCNLITHKRIHTGERPHTCPHCDKRFTQKGNLDAHLKTHSKEKPYPCGMCDKKFAHKTSLMSHIRQEHQLFDDIDEIKQGFSKYSTSPSPSDFDTQSPLNHHSSFSPGIPTPQSSLDSIGGVNSLVHPLVGPGYVPYVRHTQYLPMGNNYPPPSPSELSDISKLTATVEAATMGTGHILPPRSISSSSSASS